MKILKKSSGNYVLKITKAEWLSIAENYEWMEGPPDTSIRVNEGPIKSSPGGATLPTWGDIRSKYNNDKKHHHLKLVCVICGNVQTCRCSEPKTVEKGVCEKCRIKEDKKSTTSP
jgi:hypothetical protein